MGCTNFVNIFMPIIFLLGGVGNVALASRRGYVLKRRMNLIQLLYFCQSLLDTIVCLFLFLMISAVYTSDPYLCLLISSFSLFWFFFSFRVWLNIVIATYHYHRILSSGTANYQMRWYTLVYFALIAFISALMATLAAMYLHEFDTDRMVCGNIFEFEKELLPNRFALVRCLYIPSATLTSFFPGVAVIRFYTRVLHSLKEFEAPAKVKKEAKTMVFLDGYLLLLLTLPVHTLVLIQVMHFQRCFLCGEICFKLITMLAGTYSIIQPLLHFTLYKLFVLEHGDLFV